MHHTRAPRTRLLAAGAAIALTGGVTAGLVGGSAPALADASHSFAFGGSAYGSHVLLGSLAHVGRTAANSMCTEYAGANHANRTGKLDLGAAGHIGAVTSHLASRHSGAKSRSAASTHTAATSLLGGAVRFEAVTTTASVTHYARSYGQSGGSVFAGLKIAGRSFPARPKANTHYSLPGLGTLTLNGRHASSAHGLRAMTVTALNLVLGSKNKLGLPAGQIVVGRSTATLQQAHRLARGTAFATQVAVGSTVESGKTAAAYSPCGGTGGATRHNDVAGVSVPKGVASTGVAHSTVRTTDSSSTTTSAGVNRLARVRLLGGQVRLRAITTEANASYSHGHRSVSAAGTKLLGLTVAGRSYGSPRVGTSRHVSGLGTFYFGVKHRTSTGIAVYGLRLVLGAPRNGLPKGAVITVGGAYAAVTSSSHA